MTLLVGCMMATNAADLLPTSLACLRSCVDEIIVVDGGSIDATKSTAKAMGARVIDSPWTGENYSLQRQVYIDAAIARHGGEDGVWLLVLDSDEVLIGGEPRTVVNELNRLGMDYARLPRKWLVNTPSGLSYVASRPHYPDFQLRLFRLRSGLRYTGRIHEVLHGLGSGLDVAAPTILHLDLLRTDVAQRAQKVKRYETLEPGSGVPRFYLLERYGFILKPVSAGDSIRPYMDGINASTRVVLTDHDLRGKTLQYHLTWRLMAWWEWGQLKAKRVPRRLKRAGGRFVARKGGGGQ